MFKILDGYIQIIASVILNIEKLRVIPDNSPVTIPPSRNPRSNPMDKVHAAIGVEKQIP
jgi:hypothetical protein